MFCLALATLFNYTIHRKVVQTGASPGDRQAGGVRLSGVMGLDYFWRDLHRVGSARAWPRADSMLLSLAQWVENLPPFAALRAASYPYPIVLALHLTAISLFAGAILLTDLRLLGWVAVRLSRVAEVVERAALAQADRLCAGGVLRAVFFSALRPKNITTTCFFAPSWFCSHWSQIHALVFRAQRIWPAQRELDRAPRMPARAKVAASLSLLLWLSVLGAGRAIGYVPGRPGLHFSNARACQ